MIFCVEDDQGIRNMMIYTLKASGYEATGFSSGAQLTDALLNIKPKLILLDIMLPNEDGITILKKLKNSTVTMNIPIIMATAKGTEYDKVLALDLGADDYLAKPFGMMEMVSRVKAVLRRCSPLIHESLSLGNILINLSTHIVLVDNKQVTLTLKEFDLLCTLIKQPSVVFTRDQLLNTIWGIDYSGETRTVDAHITTLRTKLGSCKDYIQTIRGVGYRIEAKV